MLHFFVGKYSPPEVFVLLQDEQVLASYRSRWKKLC